MTSGEKITSTRRKDIIIRMYLPSCSKSNSVAGVVECSKSFLGLAALGVMRSLRRSEAEAEAEAPGRLEAPFWVRILAGDECGRTGRTPLLGGRSADMTMNAAARCERHDHLAVSRPSSRGGVSAQ